MAQRLRLYFGSGRSNTAPEILEENSEEQLPGDRDLTSSANVQDSTSENFSTRTLRLHSEPSLKRSSSMFIPQLATYSEPRPTKSSSMHISLQRASGYNNGDSSIRADDVPPPCYSPRDPAPAYPEPDNPDVPLHPPPPYCSPDLNSSTCFTEPNLPKRRVFSIGSNGYTVYSRGQPSISVGGICIQRNSPDGCDIQHVRIHPYRGTSWSVQQQNSDYCSAANGETSRVVFKLQQNQNHDETEEGQQENMADVGVISSRGNRIVRYPRIRLERSSSHPRLYQHQNTGPDISTDENQAGVDTQRIEMRNSSNGCMLNLSGDSPRSKPRFKIYFSSGGAGDQNVMAGNGSTWNEPKVKFTVLSIKRLLDSFLLALN